VCQPLGDPVQLVLDLFEADRDPRPQSIEIAEFMPQITRQVGHHKADGRRGQLLGVTCQVAVTYFTVASHRTSTDRDGQQQEGAEWFNVVAWNKLGELCGEHLRKGSRVLIEGPSPRSV
jgi:hypothetical protein